MIPSKISVCWRLPAVVLLLAMLTPVVAKGPRVTGRMEPLAGALEGPVVLASHWAVRANRWPLFR